MARTIAECDDILTAAKAAGVQVTVAKQTRHMQMAMKAKELIEDGAIGDVRIIRAMSPFSDFGLPPVTGCPTRRRGTASWIGAPTPAMRSAGSPIRTPSGSTRTTRTSVDRCALADRAGTGPDGQRRDLPGAPVVRGPGAGSRFWVNNQYLIIGAKGMIEWDLDTCRLAKSDGVGDQDRGARHHRLLRQPRHDQRGMGDCAGARIVDQALAAPARATRRQHSPAGPGVRERAARGLPAPGERSRTVGPPSR